MLYVFKLEERIKAFAERFTNSTDNFLAESSRLYKELGEKYETIQELTKQQKNPEGYKKALVESLKIGIIQMKPKNIIGATS